MCSYGILIVSFKKFKSNQFYLPKNMIHLLFMLKDGVENIFQVHINGLIFYVIG